MSRKKRLPIYSKQMLPFARCELAICVAETIQEGAKYTSKRVGKDLGTVEEDDKASAICFIVGGACALVFSYHTISAAEICHEVTHATNAMFEYIGIGLCPESDEAFAYHNEMIFVMVAQLLEKHKVKIPLIRPI